MCFAELRCAQVDLRHMDEQAGSNVVSVGVDLSEFYMSVEWDILEVPAVRYVGLFIFGSTLNVYFIDMFIRMLHLIDIFN